MHDSDNYEINSRVVNRSTRGYYTQCSVQRWFVRSINKSGQSFEIRFWLPSAASVNGVRRWTGLRSFSTCLVSVDFMLVTSPAIKDGKVYGDASHREAEDESATVSKNMRRVPQNEAPAHGFSGGRTAQGTMSRSPEAAAQSGKAYDQETIEISTNERSVILQLGSPDEDHRRAKF